MSVGVVADELSVVEPYYLAGAEALLQHLLHLCLRQGLVAVGRHKAYARGEHRAASVALDRTTFEHKVVIVDTLASEHTVTEQRAVDKIILVGSELLAPSVETKVEKSAGGYGILAVVTHRLLGWCSRDCCSLYVDVAASCCGDERDEGMVASPSVVVVALVDAHVLHLLV